MNAHFHANRRVQDHLIIDYSAPLVDAS
jgi:hypothetical protein